MTPLPPIVSTEELETERAALLEEEKALTHRLDALAARRRRLPMTPVAQADTYTFHGPEGDVGLLDLFDGRRQLVVYHFMFPPGQAEPCVGCSTFTDNIAGLEHLRARDTNLVLIARAPLDELLAYRERMGWTVPFYSSEGSAFNADFGVTRDERDGFKLSVLLRDGDAVYRTYWTTSRGVDRLRFDFNILDLTPYGRQEAWEDSPDGWPQTPTMGWLRRHDEYADAVR
ncbi:hypothetical protein DSM104299_02689 [Baekduia alba]|uniref:DUF899 domain-containing protein n=1 Tax=Baekduia alba TaxID=2997333 RepID=UPI00234136DF|nr:DUF899 domain-containing protein [Baekduia alba]WCB93962.1 hypothetical protein DSM104299_02689 [Baekduia alba]